MYELFTESAILHDFVGENHDCATSPVRVMGVFYQQDKYSMDNSLQVSITRHCEDASLQKCKLHC